jgi:hypothetical protein
MSLILILKIISVLIPLVHVSETVVFLEFEGNLVKDIRELYKRVFSDADADTDANANEFISISILASSRFLTRFDLLVSANILTLHIRFIGYFLGSFCFNPQNNT